MGKQGGDRKSEEAIKPDNVSLDNEEPEHGNSRQYALRHMLDEKMLPHLEKEAKERQEKARQEQGKAEKGRFQPVPANLPEPEESLDHEKHRHSVSGKAGEKLASWKGEVDPPPLLGGPFLS